MANIVEKTLATAALYKDIVIAKKTDGTKAGNNGDTARENARKEPAGDGSALEISATLFSLFLSIMDEPTL